MVLTALMQLSNRNLAPRVSTGTRSGEYTVEKIYYLTRQLEFLSEDVVRPTELSPPVSL